MEPFRGELVRLARQARSMSQTRLAEEAGVSQSLISMIEDDIRSPSQDQIASLCRALSFPSAFFFQTDIVLGPGVGEVFHRKRKTVPVKDLDTIHAWLNLSRFAVRRMIANVSWPPTVMPTWDDEIDNKAVEEAAAVWRATLRLPLGPIRSVSDALDRAGVLMVPMPLATQKIDAVGQWVTGLPPIIFVNPHVPQDRLRFTLLHEVGHFVLHNNPYSMQLSEEIERQADLFAGSVLLPREEILADLRNPDMRQLATLKRVWKVSMQAILMRARHLDAIDRDSERMLWREFSRNGWKTREPRELDVIGEEPFRRFTELVNLYTKRRRYSLGDLGQMVHLNPDDVSRIAGVENQGLRLV